MVQFQINVDFKIYKTKRKIIIHKYAQGIFFNSNVIQYQNIQRLSIFVHT